MSPILKSAVATLVLSAVICPIALAQAPGDNVSARIVFDDLESSAPAGAAILLKRIKSAANSVCEQAVPRSALTPRALTLCRKDTVRHAVRELANPALTAVWSGDPDVKLASR